MRKPFGISSASEEKGRDHPGYGRECRTRDILRVGRFLSNLARYGIVVAGQTEDTCDKISPESLERVGRVMVKLLTED